MEANATIFWNSILWMPKFGIVSLEVLKRRSPFQNDSEHNRSLTGASLKSDDILKMNRYLLMARSQLSKSVITDLPN